MKRFIKAIFKMSKIRKLVYLLQIPVSYVIIGVSGLFDKKWYELQCNSIDRTRLPLGSTLLHYLAIGRRKGYSPHPLFMPEYFDPRNWHTSMIDPLTRYIVDRKNWDEPTSPMCRKQDQLSIKGVKLRRISVDTDKLFENMREYRDQEALRDKTRPVKQFDKVAEQEWLKKYPLMNQELPLVSIVTPTWNREELLLAAIRSVQAQTYTNWEMLIVDDGSNDNTVALVKEIHRQDPRVKIFEAGHGGVCKARNLGIENATGEWIAFLDSDNTWTRHHLQAIILPAEKKGAKATYDAIKMNRGNDELYRTTEPNPILLHTGNYIDLNALAVRKSILDDIGYFDENLRRMVDYDLVCRISAVTEFIYAPVVGVEYTDHGDDTRITAREPVSWDGVVKSKNFINISDKGVKNLLSIVVTVHNDARTACRALDSLLACSKDWKFKYEIIIANSASTPSTSSILYTYALKYPSVVYCRFSSSHDNTLGANYGLEKARGEYVAVFDQRMVIEPGVMEELYAQLKRDDKHLYVPVHLKSSRLIHTAGEVWTGKPGVAPIHLLENHSTSDLGRAKDTFVVPMGLGGLWVARKSVVADVKGLDPIFSTGFEVHDFSLRLKERGVETRTIKTAQIVNMDERRGWGTHGEAMFMDRWGSDHNKDSRALWKDLGFFVDEYVRPRQEESYAPIIPRLSIRKKKGAYRWAIKISSPADERRFAWGDTYYAQSLKSALESLGQWATIDYHQYHDRPTSYLDDVVLDVRGLDNVQPQVGKVNLMWVISHPEKLTRDIVSRFDKVYAAGRKWAQYMNVEFMPQSTDITRFNLKAPSREELSNKVVFVGNSRNVPRPVVIDSIRAGLDVSVYGRGWERFIDQKYIKGTYIPNEELASVYGSAKVVLNDHWSDMREWGFISNRLFDATAAGAYVISDDIGDISDIFGAAVQTYTSPEELISLVSQRPSSKDLETVAHKIAKEHSFKARAERMLSDVENLINK